MNDGTEDGMARPGFDKHPKFRRLCDMLGLPAPYALGLCEMLWAVAYEQGNEVIGDAIDVELAAQWPGERGVLAKALRDCRLIDEHDGKFAIHDLFHHAPDYVKRRMEREAERRQRGTTISEERAKAASASHRPDSNRKRNQSQPAAASEPASPSIESESPAFEPPAATPVAPVALAATAKPRTRRATAAGEPEGFSEFYAAYPRKEGRKAAATAWAKIAPDASTTAAIMAGLARYTGCAQWSDPTKIPHPATFLNQERWDGTPAVAVVAASTATRDPYEEMWDGMKLKGKALRESIAKMYPPKPPAVTPAPAEPAFVG